MTDQEKDELYERDFGPPPPPMSPRQKDWEELKQIAPEISFFERRPFPESLAPKSLNDAMFLALLAFLLDPRKRRIIQACIEAMTDETVRRQINKFLMEED